MDATGVYQIRNKVNNKLYIGEAFGISKRKYQHFTDLKYNRHHNQHLQRAYNEHGIENFDHSILERIDTKDKKLLKQKEHEWCVLLNTYNENFGYNILIDEKKMGRFIEDRNNRRECVIITERIKPIYQIDNQNVIVKTWKNLKEIQEHFNVSDKAMDCFLYGAYKGKNKRVKTSRGFVWIYEENYDKDFDYSQFFIKKKRATGVTYNKPNRKKVKRDPIPYSERNIGRVSVSLQNVDTQEVKEFASRTEAANFLGTTKSNIMNLIKGEKNKGNGKMVKITQWKGWKIF